MKKVIKIQVLILTLMLAAGSSAQDFRENIMRSLVSDQKANNVGDGVTVLIVENVSATNDARTTAGRSSDISLGTSVPAPLQDVDLTSGNQFRGEGSTSSRGSIRTKISARIDSILVNGNLVISGRRKTTINGDDQFIKIYGVVRPVDIHADNTVYSYNISEAEIVVEGSGMVSRSQGPGWLTKLFHWLF